MNQHVKEIFKKTEEITGISQALMQSVFRDPPYTHARYCFAAILSSCGYTTTAIGKIIGRDHSTVSVGLARFRKVVKNNKHQFHVWCKTTSDYIKSHPDIKDHAAVMSKINFYKAEILRLESIINNPKTK